MDERIEKELELIKIYYPEILYKPEGLWFYIPSYNLPDGWNSSSTPIAFQIKTAYPGAPPYGFYTQRGLEFNGSTPQSYKANPKNIPPFEGDWSFFSWQHTDQWKPTSSLKTGSNLLNWVNSFGHRFKEGA